MIGRSGTVCGAAVLMLLAACGSHDEESGTATVPSANGAAIAAAAPASEFVVSGEWLLSRVDDDQIVVLHVAGDREEFDRGHLPGARFLPVPAIAHEADGNVNEVPPVEHLDSVFESVGVSDDSRVVLYGAPLAVARAFFTLDYLGHGDRVALLEGGVEGWRGAGGAVSMEDPVVTRSSFTPRPRPEIVVDAAWVHERLEEPGVVLLDARPQGQYSGAEAGGGVDRAGHIPGAVNLFWEDMVESTDPLEVRTPDELRAMLEDSGIEPGDTVVTYCRTGMQASFAYFVARSLGYDARMYDASYMDWNRRAELPVE